MAKLKAGQIYFTGDRDDKDDVYMFFVRREVKIFYPTATVIHGIDAYIYSFSGKEWRATNLASTTRIEDYIETGKAKRDAIKDLFLYQDLFEE